MIWFYLLSGLFLGWSLGANDAANIFGTAVGTRMIRFRTAALVSAVFVILGAVISGAGATHTLGKLGMVNAIAGSFTVALAAAITVTWMTKLKLPVSTSQAIVGAIIGWNLFTGSPTDMTSLTKIVSTWVVCPLLTAVFAFFLYKLTTRIVIKANVHMLEQDTYNRIGLLLVGAFGAYSLGANNIANVMGVFVPAAPFDDLAFGSLFTLSGTQQLFLLGGIAISVGIYTYSYRVMMTVGNDLFKLTPIAALVVVLAESIVLFLFASKSLEQWLISHGLPSLPLVPVSSSQAVIGGVIGIVLAKKGRGINFKVLGKIASGWVTTPVIAGIISFIALFFAQNVFEQKVVDREKQQQVIMQNIQKSESNKHEIKSGEQNNEFRKVKSKPEIMK
jgi:PiT family inorganic phosphate transporter